MKQYYILYSLLFLLFGESVLAQNHTPVSVPGVLYVQFKPENANHFLTLSPSPETKVSAIFKKISVTSIRPFDAHAKKDSISRLLGIDRIAVVNYDSAVEPIAVVGELLATGEIQT